MSFPTSPDTFWQERNTQKGATLAIRVLGHLIQGSKLLLMIEAEINGQDEDPEASNETLASLLSSYIKDSSPHNLELLD